MEIILNVRNGPALDPDRIDVEVPPPKGSKVHLDGRRFRVHEVHLMERLHDGTGRGHGVYVVDLEEKLS